MIRGKRQCKLKGDGHVKGKEKKGGGRDVGERKGGEDR